MVQEQKVEKVAEIAGNIGESAATIFVPRVLIFSSIPIKCR